MGREQAAEVCRLLRGSGCRSVHIGGGEPFLNFEGLLAVLRELNKAGIHVEYIETNGFWAGCDSMQRKNAGVDEGPASAGEESPRDKLKRLIAEGGSTLCISVDPFHAEYIPYAAPLRLTRLCEETGMDYFLWKQQFLQELSRLDPARSHSRSEMEAVLARSYLADTARKYGIRMGGRAVNIEEECLPARPVKELLDAVPCRGLLSTNHFHIDMDGFFIPPGCTGLRIPLAELVEGALPGKYPVFEALYQGGTDALFNLAAGRGFIPKAAGYPSKCNFCFYARHFLAGPDNHLNELDQNHYEEALMYR
jgi:hypothetical protein